MLKNLLSAALILLITSGFLGAKEKAVSLKKLKTKNYNHLITDELI